MAGVSPAERAALLFAFLGMALVGFVIGAWEPLVADPSVAFGGRRSVATNPPAGLLGLAVLFVGAAFLLARRGHKAGGEGLLCDPETGLYRPAYVAEAVNQLIAQDDRDGRSRLALVLIEIDFLDDVRRRYGRSATDQLLARVGRHVREQSRESDLPMRDAYRFVVYLRCEDLEQADAFSRRLAILLSAEQFELQGDVVKVGVSMGATIRRTGEPLESMQRRAAAGLAEGQATRSTQ